MEVLARSGGGRVTDTFHLVDSFDVVEGSAEGRFFVSGARHRPGAEAVIDTLFDGQELRLCDEPENPANPKAILLDASGAAVGWIPDWLVGDVHDLRARATVRVFVEQVNRDAPHHLRLLCKLVAQSRSALE